MPTPVPAAPVSMHDAYFVRHTGAVETYAGNITVAGQTVSVTLRPLGNNLSIAQFRTPLALPWLQTMQLPRQTTTLTILLPMRAEFLPRSLKRLAQNLDPLGDQPTIEAVASEWIALEKVMDASAWAAFFRLPVGSLKTMLLKLELEGILKLIDLSQLSIISVRHLEACREELRRRLMEHYEKRERNIRLALLAKAAKCESDQRLLRYLLATLGETPHFVISEDKLVFEKLPLSEDERFNQEELTKRLRRERSLVFSLEKAAKITQLPANQVNDAIWYLREAGQVVQLDEQHFIFADELEKIINRLKKYLRNQGDVIDVQDFRTETHLNREQIITLLEYFDRVKITRREDNTRRRILLHP